MTKLKAIRTAAVALAVILPMASAMAGKSDDNQGKNLLPVAERLSDRGEASRFEKERPIPPVVVNKPKHAHGGISRC